MIRNKKYGLAIGILTFFIVIVISVILLGSEEKAAPFEVTLEVSSNDEQKPSFTINTNLPDETNLMLTLRNSEGFMAQGHVIIEDGTGTSLEFSDHENPLSGMYTLTVSMSLPSFQSDHVRAVIGENGENITGPYVKLAWTDPDTNMISADFDFRF